MIRGGNFNKFGQIFDTLLIQTIYKKQHQINQEIGDIYMNYWNNLSSLKDPYFDQICLRFV